MSFDVTAVPQEVADRTRSPPATASGRYDGTGGGRSKCRSGNGSVYRGAEPAGSYREVQFSFLPAQTHNFPFRSRKQLPDQRPG